MIRTRPLAGCLPHGRGCDANPSWGPNRTSTTSSGDHVPEAQRFISGFPRRPRRSRLPADRGVNRVCPSKPERSWCDGHVARRCLGALHLAVHLPGGDRGFVSAGGAAPLCPRSIGPSPARFDRRERVGIRPGRRVLVRSGGSRAALSGCSVCYCMRSPRR